ncbi:MAG: pyroglutamyl-peptidase I [Candidatus Binataceae bacterium]
MNAAFKREPIFLLSGFEPFGGERTNPSWEVGSRFDGKSIAGMSLKVVMLPVAHGRAARAIVTAIRRWHPAAVIGLGQASGRPALSLERVAINLLNPRRRDEAAGGGREMPVVRGGPDAYFSRLPNAAILRRLMRNQIPAAMSLSAGAYICNSVMYATLHELRRRPNLPTGFIHLPYATSQAVRHRGAPSMSIEVMERAIELAISVTASGIRTASR